MPNQIIPISPKNTNLIGQFREDMIFVLADTSLGAFSSTMPEGYLSKCFIVNVRNIGAPAFTLNFPEKSRLHYYDTSVTSVVIPSGRSIDFFNEPLSGKWRVCGDDYDIFGGQSDNLEIESDGTLILHGNATTWNDINVAGTSLGVAASAPDLIQLNSGTIYVRGFDGNVTTEQLFGDVEIIHTYKEGTDLVPHVHWMPTTTNAGNVKWQMTYAWTNRGSAAPAEATISVVQAAGGTAWVQRRADFPAISGSGKGIGSHLSIRFFRDPSDGSDTYPNDAAVLSIGFHHEIDSLGSRGITSK